MFPFKPGSSSPKSAAGTPGSPSSLSSACAKSECNHPRAYKWIQCEKCRRWHHCVCAGILPKTASSNTFVFICDFCM